MDWQQVFVVNPKRRVSVETIGRDRQRVFVVDDYYLYPERVRELAQSLHYVSGGGDSFPGARAMISIDTRPLIAAMSEIFGARLEPLESFHPVIFAAIKNDGSRLTNAQRQPHIDPGNTGLVYMNTPDQCSGGTALYRHRLTGLEKIPLAPTPGILALAAELGTNPETLKTAAGYKAFQDSIVFNPLFAAKGNSYVNDGNEFWELLHLVEMKFNRLVLVDGRIPHSQHLSGDSFSKYPRVTQTFYFKA